MQNFMLYNFGLNKIFRISNRYGVTTQFIVTFQMVKQLLLPKPFQNVILAQIWDHTSDAEFHALQFWSQ